MRYLIYLLVACPGLLSAQQNYHRYFNVEGDDRMNDLIVLSDSLMVGIGTSTPESGPERAFLLTLNTEGEILRSNGIDYPLRTRGMTLARQSDSTFWAGCWRTPEGIIDDWLIYRVNALTGTAMGFGWGDPDSDEQIRTMMATADGGVVVAGNTGDFNEAIIASLGADGNERFRKGFSIPGNTYTIITDLKLAADGDILAAGIFDPTGGPSSPKGYFLLRLSPQGELRWSQRYDLPDGESADGFTVSIAVLPDGSFALAGTINSSEGGRALLMRTTAEGLISSTQMFVAGGGLSGRNLLVNEQNELLLIGVAGQISAPGQGVVFRLDSDGNLPAAVTAFRGIRGLNRLSGGTPRPGGGYYFYGSGLFCSPDDRRDALLISIGETLVDTVSNCFELTGSSAGFPMDVTATSDGLMFDRTDPPYPAPGLSLRSSDYQDQFCARIGIFPADLPQPVCYQQPVRLLDTVLTYSPRGSVLDMNIILGGAAAGAWEWLEVSNDNPDVMVAGNRTDRITLSIRSNDSGSTLTQILSSLRYGIDGALASGGTRVVGIQPSGGCSQGAFNSFRFAVLPSDGPLIGLPADTVLCPGDSLALSTPSIAANGYRWSTGDTLSGITVDNPGTYALTVTNACGRDSTTVIVREAASDQLLDDYVREIACLGDSLSFSPRLEDDVAYRWEDGPEDPARIFRKAGTYVLLRSNTCYVATTTLDLRFADCCQIYFPNAFSPNGDGVNDRYLPAPALDGCDELSNWSLRLFNRWGGEVFATDDRFEGWDGSFRARPAPNGVYVFQLDYFNGRETIHRSGSFTLLR